KLGSKADVIYTVSTVERKILKKKFPNKPIRCMPVLIPSLTDDKRRKRPPFGQRAGLLFVGQFRHQPNVDGMIWFLQTIFAKLLEMNPDVTCTIVGSHPPSSIRSFQSENVKITGYVSDQVLAEQYRTTRLVIAPLRFGAGAKGKVVEAMG